MAPEGEIPPPDADGVNAVAFVDVVKRFDKSGPPVLDGINVTISAGDIVGIIGPSGAGKSTLARLINGLERPTTGRVEVHGRDHSRAREKELNDLRTQIGMIFQQFNLFNSKTVSGNVEFALRVAGIPRDQRRSRVTELLEFVGIADKAGAWPSSLSGGQKQRVGIARALAASPSILIADEATSALDPQTTADTLKLLRRINTDLGTTIVVITHEMDVVREVCRSVVVLENGKLVDHGEVYEVFNHPTSDVTRGLVRHAVAGAPDGDLLDSLRSRHAGTLVSVPVRDQPTDFDLPGLLAGHGVSATVIYGGIVDLAGRPFGSLTYELAGTDAAVGAVRDIARATDGVIVHDGAAQ